MLFDTSSPGRKRGVQIIFGGLALLMGAGLVLFGIGSNVQGGSITDIFNGGGNDFTAVADQAKDEADSAQEALTRNPKDTAAAARLARARLTVATEEAFDQDGKVSSKEGSQGLVDAADDAWTNYLALGPDPVDRTAARGYAIFYTYAGVNQLPKAARALEASIGDREVGPGVYAQLATLWLYAGDRGNYREARARALATATSTTRRTAITRQLDEYAKQYDQAVADAEKQQAADGAGEGTTPKLPSLPAIQR